MVYSVVGLHGALLRLCRMQGVSGPVCKGESDAPAAHGHSSEREDERLTLGRRQLHWRLRRQIRRLREFPNATLDVLECLCGEPASLRGKGRGGGKVVSPRRLQYRQDSHGTRCFICGSSRTCFCSYHSSWQDTT